MEYAVNERIKTLIEYYHESVRAFAARIDVPQTTLNSIVINARKANVEVIERIIKSILNINPMWLITGEGEMFLSGKVNDGIPRLINESLATKAPLITQYAHGSYLNGFADQEFREAQPLYIASKKYSGGNYVAFEVRGSSMDDNTKRSICNGDVVLGKELQKHYWSCKLHTPKVFIIVHKSEGITIKEIVDHNVESGIIICHPYNSEHQDFELNLKDIMQLFYIKEIKREA